MVDANVLVSELLRVRGRGLIGDSALELRVSEETLDEALHEMTRRATRIVEQGRVNQDTANTMLDDARGLVERRILPIPREVYAD